MDKTFDPTGVQATCKPSAINFVPMTGHSYDPSHESSVSDAANENLDGYEQENSDCEQLDPRLTDVDKLLAIEIWKPAEPQYCRAICAHYGVKNRTVQKWFDKIAEACPWFSEAELRLSDDRYTPLCVELMGDYRASGLIARKWGAKMAERFADRIAVASTPTSEPPAIRPEVLLPEEGHRNDIPGNNGNASRPGGMVLHLGSSLALPTIPGVITPGNDTAYLTQTQQRLQQFEAMQQQVLAQMQQQQEEAEALNAQYQEATSLSDQLLLQEFQLKGVQLGYTALQLKQQAFKATVQAAEAGTLPAPGKPQSENGQSQSA